MVRARRPPSAYYAARLRPDSGTIHVAGYEVPKQVEKAREEIGYLAQKFSLYGDLTVKENLDFFGEVFDMPDAERQQRSKELLHFAGLEEFANRPAAALSGGMQKKLGLASALVHSPKVLLLDEPTGGVDPVARQEFWHLLIGLLRGGSAVLVSTPYMDEAMRFNRVIFMDHGRALIQGAPRELMARLSGRILELAAEPQLAARDVAVTGSRCRGRPFIRRIPAPARPLGRGTDGTPPWAIESGRHFDDTSHPRGGYTGGRLHTTIRDGRSRKWQTKSFQLKYWA